MIYEYGHAVPQGPVHLKPIARIIEAENSDLPELGREEVCYLIKQIAEKTARIEAKTRKIAALAALAPTARRLQTMPGVGPPLGHALHVLPGNGSRRWRSRPLPPRWRPPNAGVISPHGSGWCRGSCHPGARSGWGASPRPGNLTYGAF